jgi:hypothetical protein
MSNVAKYRKELSDAAERLERFALSATLPDEECDKYFSGNEDRYHADLKFLIKESRKVVDGLGWYDSAGRAQLKGSPKQ